MLSSRVSTLTRRFRLLRNDYSDITEKNTPCWYEILWNNGRLELRIRKEVFGHFQDFFPRLPTAPRIMEMQERLAAQGYPLGGVSIDPKTSLGFGNQIRFLSEENGFWTYQIPLPLRGSEAFLVSASLTHATTLLKLFNMERILEGESFQLLSFATSTDVDLYGAPIVGEIGIPLRGFLDRMYREENTDGKTFVEQAMAKAWRKMHGKVTFSEKIRLSFKLREHGFFHLDCPGNACGLDPGNYPKSMDKGYEFCPHNTDTPKQQLTLLTGLAAICTLAKKG